MALRSEIVGALDRYLDINSITDASLNGLQVEGGAEVHRVATAVDAAQATIDAAIESYCQLLCVHHGLFWGPQVPLIGAVGRRVHACFGAELSVYAAPRPLDATFGDIGGVEVGVLASFEEATDIGALAGRLAAAGCDEPLIWSFGGEEIRRIAVVTGRGCSVLEAAVDAGADCFVTVEPVQEAYHLARDHGIHCLFGGHYATETFGVRALGDWLVQQFDVETVWIDHPTGV